MTVKSSVVTIRRESVPAYRRAYTWYLTPLAFIGWTLLYASRMNREAHAAYGYGAIGGCWSCVVLFVILLVLWHWRTNSTLQRMEGYEASIRADCLCVRVPHRESTIHLPGVRWVEHWPTVLILRLQADAPPLMIPLSLTDDEQRRVLSAWDVPHVHRGKLAQFIWDFFYWTSIVAMVLLAVVLMSGSA
jgi:hypothetical protein